MKEIIEVFRMEEISRITRSRIIIELGLLVNNKFQSNISNALVFELVSVLDPSSTILKQPEYLRAVR